MSPPAGAAAGVWIAWGAGAVWLLLAGAVTAAGGLTVAACATARPRPAGRRRYTAVALLWVLAEALSGLPVLQGRPEAVGWSLALAAPLLLAPLGLRLLRRTRPAWYATAAPAWTATARW
jgi:hypothetical protein